MEPTEGMGQHGECTYLEGEWHKELMTPKDARRIEAGLHKSGEAAGQKESMEQRMGGGDQAGLHKRGEAAVYTEEDHMMGESGWAERQGGKNILRREGWWGRGRK